MSGKVLISIVTYNSARFIGRCLQGIGRQTYQNVSIAIIDNASMDNTVEVVRGAKLDLTLVKLDTNVGFCAAHNLAIDGSASDYVLVLNPDVFLTPEFLEEILKAFDIDSSVGSASGKLLRIGASFYSDPSPDPQSSARIGQAGGVGEASQEPYSNIIDSTGIYFTPSQRHLDRGSNDFDQGQYERVEYVFGASGAAAVYRRAMIEDVKVNGQFFDEDFFAYREDADLAWRAQLLGWKCLYMPRAVAYHVRRVLPGNRAGLPPEINRHSVKNRFLMRIKNMDVSTYLKFFIPIMLRDLQVVGYVLLRERTSISGLLFPLKHFRKLLTARKFIQGKRQVSNGYINRWFSYRPQTFSLEGERTAGSPQSAL